MTARDYLNLLGQQWRVIVAAGLLGVVLAGILVLFAPVKYAASVTLYISTQQTNSSSTDAYQGSLLSQDRVKSYTQLLSGYRLGQEVVTDLGLNDDPQAVADEVSASVSPNTVLLTAEVTDTSPERAEAIAGAIGRRFPALIAQLEKPANSTLPPSVTATVVQGPLLEPEAVSPRPLTDLGIGLGAGLLVGVVVAVLRRTLDRSVRTTEQLAEVFPKPLLGTLAEDRTVETVPLFLRDRPTSPIAESLRAVRANVDMLDLDRTTTVVAVTSAIEDEGKSTLLVNLALAQANAGRRVLVVEGDLRKPRAAQYLGLSEDVGLTQVLTGRASVDDVVQAGPAPRLELLASGPRPPNPCEMVESPQMSELLATLRERYDLVLVDAPPLLPVADGLALARLADGVVFTVRAGFTSGALVRRAHEMLETAGVGRVGVVLNRTKDAGDGYYAGYYYAEAERTAAPTPAPSPTPGSRQEFATVPSPSPESDTEQHDPATAGRRS
ncbi:polysaccharide biosynthesis tyrosine autokinase [Actinomycetospora termitidis]|uniref:Polysaccharide biosynthesis tyrosine autokinase n=1 Tax=Actinomycetospora termitidis TaxID=3053470 RepID=A0ABT7MES7_9PSEU|nr:polysaccharide biosynthesis tyrosine autokinase [Actinomycetospora sp. Odt1-22]MDL5159173.1 polysaccharide biosynthesis tyrosine autokinase [Actinomycetospora sp. Odt1-22]